MLFKFFLQRFDAVDFKFNDFSRLNAQVNQQFGSDFITLYLSLHCTTAFSLIQPRIAFYHSKVGNVTCKGDQSSEELQWCGNFVHNEILGSVKVYSE